MHIHIHKYIQEEDAAAGAASSFLGLGLIDFFISTAWEVAFFKGKTSHPLLCPNIVRLARRLGLHLAAY